MKISVVTNTYLVAMTSLVLTFTVGCTKGSQSKGAAAMGVASATSMGTGDGAGGNGVDRKAYESYIRDPRTLPAYKIVAKKLAGFDKMNQADQAANQAANQAADQASGATNNQYLTVNQTEFLWKMKKWYFAPVSLNSISKANLGITFTKGDTQQYAIQNQREVWVDSKFFDAMKVEDQANLLLHEYVMGMYLLRFTSPVDLCKLVFALADKVPTGMDSTTCDNPSVTKYSTPAEPLRELTAKDYENVRAMTSLLMEQGETIQSDSLENYFTLYNFPNQLGSDPSPSLQGAANATTIDLSAAKTLTLLKELNYSKKINGPCMGRVTQEKRNNCVFSMQVVKAPDESQLGLVEISITDGSSNQVLTKATYTIMNSGLLPYVHGQDKYYSFTISEDDGSKKEGDTVSTMQFFLKSDSPDTLNGNDFIGLVFSQSVLSSLVVSPTDANSYCKNFVTPNPKSLTEDTIIVTTDPALQGYATDTFIESSSEGSACTTK